MSFAYKVEELLALRDSVSESAVSIERFADEEVIKEHVLRPSASASANLTSRSSNRSLRPPIASTLGTASDKKPSPSPSIKRGKAEKLLKEHGSPPGLRVTAGGRIVPSDLAPLATSRFGDTFKPQTLRVSPGNAMSTQPTAHNNTARIEVVDGQPVVFIGDQIFALPSVNMTNPILTVQVPGSTDSTTKQVPDMSHPNTHGKSLRATSVRPTVVATPFDGLDLPALKAQQTFKKQELRTVEQTEVLQSGHQNETWRANMIERKRSLIVELDALRKQIVALETDINNNNNNPPSTVSGSIGLVPASVSTGPNSSQHPYTHSMYGYPAVNPYGQMIMYPPQPFVPFAGLSASEVTAIIPPISVAPHSPGSVTRRSHAIEIKPPPEHMKKSPSSVLDPKSPTYEPALKLHAAHDDGEVPPTPSPSRRLPWQFLEQKDHESGQLRGVSQKPSLSSIDTTDFFPKNTHEHSSTRVAPHMKENGARSKDVSILPSTPEKHWPASPWNEGHSGRSRHNEPTSKLTSWPEAFGQQPNLSSLQNPASGQSIAAMHEHVPPPSANKISSADNSNISMQISSGQRTGTDENLPFSSRMTAHVPSTYQEGYQAGYDHFGMPDSPEVLQGYIQGLLHYLADESKKRQASLSSRLQHHANIMSNATSLRGLVAESLPHDSAVSMNFERDGLGSHFQDKLSSAAVASLVDGRRDSTFTSNGISNGDMPQYTSHELTSELSQRNKPTAHYLDAATVGDSAELRAIPYQGNKNATYTSNAARAGAFANNEMTRKGFGEQLQNRGYSAPTLQRFYPSPKDASVLGSPENRSYTTRPLTSDRMSGLDGAVDDLSDMIKESDMRGEASGTCRPSLEGPARQETEDLDASCFKSSGAKGKQKAASPSKPAGNGRDTTTSPLGNHATSPKKSSEHSPAKVKLEQVTNKFRRVKKDDPRAMSPEEKKKRSDKWRARFQQLKKTESEEIEEYRRNNQV